MISALLIGLAVVVSSSVSLAGYPRPGVVERVSVASDGMEANLGSASHVISADGRHVAFMSQAEKLVPGDTNKKSDVFLRDRDTGITERVSVASDGTEDNLGSRDPAISADGRYVAFASAGFTLVPDDMNLANDVFVHDRDTGMTERVSVASDGTEGDGHSDLPTISGDGRFVAFQSDAFNLVPGDTNGKTDVFVHDRDTGMTERVSVASNGAEATGQPPDSPSIDHAISGDGRYVAFSSQATNLVPDDTNGTTDVFVHDRDTGKTERVSVASDGAEGTGYPGLRVPLLPNPIRPGGFSIRPAISADGRFVAFQSEAFNLVPGDINRMSDIFVRDRDADENGIFDESGEGATRTELVSVASDGTQGNLRSAAPAISPDGRYVGFSSDAANLVPGDTNGVNDVFVRDRAAGATERVSMASDGTQGNDMSFAPAFSADGRFVAFHSSARNLVPGDNNDSGDTFVRDRGATVGLVGELTGGADQDSVTVEGTATFSSATLSSRSEETPNGEDGAQELGAELTSAALIYRVEEEDLLVRLGVESLPPVVAGSPGVVYGVKLQLDSSYQVRALRASATGPSNVAPPPPGTPSPNPRLPYVALYQCGAVCTEIATLNGSIGTSGNEVLVSVPRSALGFTEGDTLSSVRAYSAAGEANPGPGFGPAVGELDHIDLADATVPTAQVKLGLAPRAAPETEVCYDHSADLDRGKFTAEIPTASLADGDYRVWVRACLATCGAPATMDVAVASQSGSSPNPSPSACGASPAPTATPTATSSTSPTPSNSPSASPSTSSNPTSSASPTATASASPSVTPTATPSQSPSATPSQSQSATPSQSPSATPSQSPTASSTTQVGSSSVMTITLSSAKDKIVFGKKVRLVGQVDAGSCQPHEVAIGARRAGKSAFKDLRTVTLESDGSFALRLKRAHNASYVATVNAPDCDAASTTPAHVAVKAAITARTPKRCRPGAAKITGRVKPNHRKTVVLLQRKIAKVWNDVGGDRLSRRSRYVVEAPWCRGAYRLVWPKQNELNESGMRRFRF